MNNSAPHRRWISGIRAGAPQSALSLSKGLALFEKWDRVCAIRAALALAILPFTIPGQAQPSPQVLHNHVRPVVARGQAVPVGHLPLTQHLQLAIMLPLRNQAELTSLLDRLYDPTSPDYRQFLSVAQFTKRFGPTEQDYQAVVDFAKANGFKVTNRPPNRLLVDVNGSVEQINKAFHVTMMVYRHPTEGRTFYSPNREPSLNLSVPVSHIAGLDNFSIPRPMLMRAPAGKAIRSNLTGSGPGGSYLGSDMRAAYYGGAAFTGNGQAVGLLEFGGYNLSDVDLTFTTAGQAVPSVPINNVLLDGASGGANGNDTEEVLDIVQAISMAPGLSQLRVYIGSSDVDIFNQMATENLCQQLSVSWAWYPDDPSSDDPIFQEFAAQGQSIFVASGDWGSYPSSTKPYYFPAEDAYVTAVGGTDLTTTGPGGPWLSETAWTPDSGGGISPDGILIPSWQAGMANTSNDGSTTYRNVPDVAAEANFDNYACNMGVCEGGWGGTSFAAPRWAGFMTLVNQQAVEANNPTVGFINPAIYTIGEGSSYNSDLHDIVNGNNCDGGTPCYYAVTGYDLVTGWGSPNGQNLINALAGFAAPGFTLVASPSGLSIEQGALSTTTITVHDLGGFTDSVDMAISNLPSGVTAQWGTNPTTETSVLTLTASGTATLGTAYVTITGTSGTLVTTTTIALTVIPNFALSANPSILTIQQGVSDTTTITVTDVSGFSGSVTLAVSGLPNGVTAQWSTNPTTGTSVLTLTASATAALGTTTVTITGSSPGVQSATTTLTLTVIPFTSAAQENILLSFNGLDGMTSLSGLVAGPSGNFYGVTSIGGHGNCADWGGGAGCGTVYELTSPAESGGAWTETVLYNFQGGADGDEVVASLILDAQGNLYGVTELGGGGSCTYGCGTIFELSPPATQGGSWTKTTLYTFQGGMTDGSYPEGTLVFDAKGNLYGTSFFGGGPNCGGYGCGTVFELSPSKTGGGWSETALHVFVGPDNGDGYLPNNNLVFDAEGNLYGTADSGGAYNNGAVFELSPPTGQGGKWTEQVIYSFIGAPDGANPESGLTPGANGVFYGVASGSGPAEYGTVYQLTPPAPGSSQWTLAVLFGFNLKAAGGNPGGPLVLDASGNLYGTTAVGGDYSCPSPYNDGCGVVFELVNSSGRYSENVLHSFTGTGGDGIQPESGLIMDALGNLYGTTELGGTQGYGTVFEIASPTTATPGFTLSDLPGSLSIVQGASGTSTVTVTDVNGFTGSVTLAASGLPSGVTAAFGTNPTTGSSVLTLTASSTATIGTATVTITGTSGSLTATTTLALTVKTFTATSLTSSLNPSNYGQAVTFTAAVAPAPPNGETITFMNGITALGTGTLSGGSASFATSALAGGTYSITAVYAGDSNFFGSTSNTVSQTVNPVSQSITFTTNAPASAAYNSNFTVAASASSGLAVTYTSSGSCSNSGATYTMTGSTGTCSVIANQAGNSNYLAAPQATASVTATRAKQSIVFTYVPSSAAYNSNFTVAATGGASGIPVTFTSGGSCSTVGATYTMTSGTGTCTVIANQAGNSNYSAAPMTTASVTATKATQSIAFTINAPATAAYNSNFTVAVSASSGLAVGYTSFGSCGNAGATYTMTSGSGTCSVIANQAGNNNYLAATPVTQNVTATPATQSITFTRNAPASAAYNSSFTVAASASSGLAVTYTSSGVCSNVGATYTMTSGMGTCSVIANQAGNGNYSAATPVTQSVIADKGTHRPRKLVDPR